MKQELNDAYEEIGNMDGVIKESWARLKEAQQKKRSAQRELRIERSSSQELVKHYTGLEKELAYYKSDKTGFIERKAYLEIVEQLKDLNIANEEQMKMATAWKHNYTRLRITTDGHTKEIEKYELMKSKLQEQITLMKTQADSLQAQLDYQRAKTQEFSDRI